jgi:putative transcriptional regulator
MVRNNILVQLAKRRLNQTDLHKQTGIRLATINAMVNDKAAYIPLFNAEKLCKFFNCGIGDLWEYIPDKD